MSSAVSALIPQLANYNPAGFVQQNQLRQQQMGLNAAQTAAEQARVPYIQQQTQGAVLQNQLVQQQINDQKALGQAWASWDQQADPDGRTIGPKAIKLGATPQSVMAVEQHRVQYAASLANADKTTLENHKAKNDDFAGKIQAIIEAPAEQQDQMIASYKGDLLADDPKAQIPDHFDLNAYKGLQKVHMYQSDQTKQALEAQQTATSAAQGQEATAKAKHQEIVNKLIDTGNQAAKNGQHPIDAISAAGATDPSLTAILQGFRASYDALGQTPPDENGRRPAQDATVEAAARAAAQYREKLSPQLRQAEVQRAVETKQATAPIETATAVNTEAAKLRLQQSLSTDIFAGVASPQDRAKATAEYQGYSSKFIDSMEASQGLRDLIDQAQHGNKAAPGLIGIAELRTYLNRVTTPELRSVTGAGNLVDKVEGFLKGAIEGQPIPPDILQATDQIAQMQQQQAQRKYSNQLGLLGTTYNRGQAPPAFQWQPHSGQQAAQPAGAMSRGKLTDPNVAMQYLQKAGGDKGKARQLAKQDGWDF